MQNKNHWYDGLFYDKIIAPNQDRSFAQLKDLIKENSTLLDAGCGTGRLAFQVAGKCKRVVGVDLSERNISVAKKKQSKNNFNNIEFHHADINTLQKKLEIRFDYAVISYVIHEIDETLRKQTLNSLSQAAEIIVIIDYLIPRPGGIWSFVNETVEFLAGKDHYKNFKSYIKNNGIEGLAGQNGFKIISEIKNNPLTAHIAVLTKEKYNV